MNGGRTGKPHECMIDGSESPTARGSFDSRRPVCGKENLEFSFQFFTILPREIPLS